MLKRHNIDYWYSKANISTAEEWEVSIRQGLKSCDWFLVVLSEVGVKSDWVRAELQWAIQNRKSKIIPLLLRDCDQDDIPIRLLTIQYIDFRHNMETASRDLLKVWGYDYLPKGGKNDPSSSSDLDPQETEGLILPESQIGLGDLSLTEQLYLLCADDDEICKMPYYDAHWTAFGLPIMAIAELVIAKKVSLEVVSKAADSEVLLTVIDRTPLVNPILNTTLAELSKQAAVRPFDIASNNVREIFGIDRWEIVANALVSKRVLTMTIKKSFFGLFGKAKYSIQALERRHQARLKFSSILASEKALPLDMSLLSLVAYECFALPSAFLSKLSAQQEKSIVDRASKYPLAQLIAKTVHIAVKVRYDDEGMPAGAS